MLLMWIALIPHGYCFFWNPILTGLHAMSDFLITTTYFAVPGFLWWNRQRAPNCSHHWIILFSVFVFSCGINHTLKIWNLWHSDYWLEGVWNILTAFLSLYAAWKLYDLLPSFLKIQQKLETNFKLAHTDLLTQLKNRRGFDQILEQSLRHSNVTQHHKILLMLDLDGFKAVNDQYGHAMGDSLLQSVAKVVQDQVRSTDTVARLGGDEFVVLLEHCSRSQAQMIAETIRQQVSRLIIDDAVNQITVIAPVTVSIGLSAVRQADTPTQLCERSDRLLYTAKKQGKNRIVSDDALNIVATVAQSPVPASPVPHPKLTS
jgi:diguanylate cyclase (GGDEF)-like protein